MISVTTLELVWLNLELELFIRIESSRSKTYIHSIFKYLRLINVIGKYSDRNDRVSSSTTLRLLWHSWMSSFDPVIFFPRIEMVGEFRGATHYKYCSKFDYSTFITSISNTFTHSNTFVRKLGKHEYNGMLYLKITKIIYQYLNHS